MRRLKAIFHGGKSKGNARTTSQIPIVFIIVIIVLVVDTSISNVSDLLNLNLVWWSTPVFIAIMAASFGLGQYFILDHVRHLTSHINRSSTSRATTTTKSWLNRSVTITQYYIIMPILVLVIIQLAIASYYYPILITLAMTCSYLLSGIIFSMLSIRFFRWFLYSKYNDNSNMSSGKSYQRKNTTVLFYALASTVTTIAVILTLVFYDSIIVTSFENVITAIVHVNSRMAFPTLDPNTMMGMINSIYSIFNIISFILLWASSVLLLQQYLKSRRFVRLRFLFLLVAPLFFFLSQFVVLAIPSAQSDVYLITSYTLQGLVAGLLFGLPFLVIGRSITVSHGSIQKQQQQLQGHSQILLKRYISLCGYGFILFFVSGTATLVHTPYPPFGLASIAFVGLSSYIIFVGLYYSAAAISQDTGLRQSIRRFSLSERGDGRGTKLLDSIGTAQMQQDIENRVTKLVKEQAHSINNQTGVYLSPTKEEIKEYLNDVLTEISKMKVQERNKNKD